MLRRLRLRGFDGLGLFGCRHSSIGRRPIHRCSVPIASIHRRELSDSTATNAATKDPRWVMLNCAYGIRIRDSIVGDPNTVADSLTSRGQHLRVCLERALPPGSSSLYYDWPDSLPGEMDNEGINVIAVHGDSALLETRDIRSPYPYMDNYFVYTAGGTARPPSLTLLPPAGDLDFSKDKGNTGLLRRGKDDLLVVQHELNHEHIAESDFSVHRLGTNKWELVQAVPILDYTYEYDTSCEMEGWATTAPILVGDRFLCWVQHGNHFLLSDMADEASQKVRYVPLPPDLSHCGDHDYDEDDPPPTMRPLYTKNICATGASRVKFVRIETHCCCCGGPCKITCEHPGVNFTVNTWSMNLSMDEQFTWVKDGVLDCEELWALPGYEGLPRACLECPVVSLDNPEVICFSVTNFKFLSSYKDCYTVWIIQLNMRSKTLMSVVKYTTRPSRAYYHLPAKL
ncbi:unnamed protein product [Urochloa decumbens]|uniref:DUF1618 domain-containing protein n=1 Tax=Urochloa decumbens TaxID=240449 RepID=A0ABC9AS11_9POAL